MIPPLTARQAEVVRLAGEGLTMRGVARACVALRDAAADYANWVRDNR